MKKVMINFEWCQFNAQIYFYEPRDQATFRIAIQ